VATPDRDTLGLADSLVLVVRSDSLEPLLVTWIIEPRGDTVVADTLVYRPPAAGTEYVRARAAFAGERVGTGARRVVTRPNAAPIVAIAAAHGGGRRLALGDTIVLAAVVADPDGDTDAPWDLRWYLADFDDGSPLDPLGTADTLRFPVSDVATYRFHLVVTDRAGAHGDAWYTAVSYDPVTPARWRMRVSTSWVDAVSRHPSGLILVLSRYGAIAPLQRVVALTDSGAVAWTVNTQLSGSPLVVGDDGGIYHGGGSETGTGQSQTKLVKLGADGSEAWTIADARAISGPVLLWDGALAVPRLTGVSVTEPDGSERWTASVDSIDEVVGLAVGADSTLYVLGYTSSSFQASVSAFTASGGAPWRVRVGSNSTNWVMVPADDSTLLVGGPDSLFALRRDGSVRWSRSGGLTHPAIGNGQAYFVSWIAGELSAVSLVNGGEVWRVALPAGWTGWPAAPVLTSAGDVIVAARSTLLALDAGSGQERWRHELSGTLTATLLLTAGGDLIAGDSHGFVEAIPYGAGPLPSPWPQAWADERRTGRARRP
jgi:hypothetical protein